MPLLGSEYAITLTVDTSKLTGTGVNLNEHAGHLS